MDAEAAKVASELTDYLVRHPMAADTPAGIATWWLSDGMAVRPEAIDQALEHLVARGVLRRRRLPSGELLYSAR